MGLIAVDLGTTNVKAALYNNQLNMLNSASIKIDYQRQGEQVEFDAEAYFDIVTRTIRECCQGRLDGTKDSELVLTGQAESLVVLGADGKPLRNAISWLDERSSEECKQLQAQFDAHTYYGVTGQISITPTWPITKILWLKRHEPEVYAKAHKYLLLKDYILFCLTGKLVGELSIYNFSSYLDIHKKDYWQEILDFCDLHRDQLPELVEPCTNLGRLLPAATKEIGLPAETLVNVGTLDHFAGMIGTGNIRPGVVSESTGTVLSIATLLEGRDARGPEGIPCHYGPFKDSYVLLSTCDSGGVSLEWYKDKFMASCTYADIETEIQQRERPGEVTFLPYLTGVNPPEFDKRANGVFHGLKLRHDAYDLALAVMEGVACMLARNVEFLRHAGYKVDRIISTGGGARSRTWLQIKADLTGCEIAIPQEKEAACLGAAMIGALDLHLFDSFAQMVEQKVSIADTLQPERQQAYQAFYARYAELYATLEERIWGK